MNRVILVGRTTKDLELRYTPAGTAVGTTTLAVDNSYKNKNGQKIEDTLFIDLQIWGRGAENFNKFFKEKGKKFLIEGSLKLNTWTDQQGNKKQKHFVQVESFEALDCKQQQSKPAQQSYSQPTQTFSITDDEIPF